MRGLIIIGASLALLFSGLSHADADADATGAARARPNILLIVADDMGYTDLGSFGSEISTPNLDHIASLGVRLTNFHTLPTCAPTRSVLLTGTDNHIAGLGSQLNSVRQDGQPGYEGHLNGRVVTAAEVLASSGYRTYMAGKWHLGLELQQSPSQRGFQETFVLLPGGASHYADAQPLHPAEPVVYRRNGKVVESLPDDFYSTRYYTDNLLSWLNRDANSGAPFFAYLAYTAPHDPLHAPRPYIDKYKGVYDAGYEVFRERRFSALKTSGLIAQDVALPPWPVVVRKWDSLSVAEQARSQRNMEVYAAMIDYMDEQIGRVYTWLEDHGQLDNTLIVFMSDNGANGFPATMYPTHDAQFHAQFDNSLQNLGRPGSFTDIGSGWATAVSGPYRRFKGFITEGGIRAPAIVKMPAGQLAASANDNYVDVSDWLPTFLELAGTPHPSQADDTIADLRGSSLVSTILTGVRGFSGSSGRGFEVHGARAFFKGDWKAVQNPPPLGSGEWQIFNLREDPAETTNLAFQEREKLAELVADHAKYEREVGVVFDVVPIVEPIARGLWVVRCLIVFLVLWSMARMRSNLTATTMGYGLLKLACLALLFGPYFVFAGWLLVSIMLGEGVSALTGKRKRRTAWLPLTIAVLLVLQQLIQSGYLIWFML